MPHIPEFITDPAGRGYDHPKDRMRFANGLISVRDGVGVRPLFTEEQGYKAADRLFLPPTYRDDAVEAIGRVAMNCLRDSDDWEVLNLNAMAFQSADAGGIFDEYERFAGNKHNVAGFINWFANTARALPSRPAGIEIVGHEGKIHKGELITDEEVDGSDSVLQKPDATINGYTLTTGIANQIGGYNLSHTLNTAYTDGLNNIVRPQYGFEVETRRRDSSRRHRVELVELGDKGWQTDDGDVLLHITRERGDVNITRKRDSKGEQHPQILWGIKRFDSMMALRGISLVRGIIDLLATESGTMADDKYSHEMRRLMQKFEIIIRQQGKSRAQQDIRVVPLLTTQLLRDPKK